MKKLLIPLLAVLIGLGVGVGANVLVGGKADDTHAADNEGHAEDSHDTGGGDEHHASTQDAHGDSEASSFFSFPGQFVIPVMDHDRVEAVLLMSIGVQTTDADRPVIVHLEPKLRAGFLSALFDRSSMGALSGDFTSPEWRNGVRDSLAAEARQISGGRISDVLLLEINRQDL